MPGPEDMGDDVERKGLGTPATRADIIEKLVKDGFVKRDKKQMIPTEDGIKLITVLPDVVKSPKLTADWENALTLVAKGELPMEDFMADIENMVSELIHTYHEVSEQAKNKNAPTPLLPRPLPTNAKKKVNWLNSFHSSPLNIFLK